VIVELLVAVMFAAVPVVFWFSVATLAAATVPLVRLLALEA
jgi:hypothetical protein